MKKWLVISVLCSSLSLPLIACGSNDHDSGAAAGNEAHASLPAAVPSGLPFPKDADLTVQTMKLSGATQNVITFSFSGDAAALYKAFRQYALNNGYRIQVENKGMHQFSSNNASSGGLGVRIADMGAVKIMTVSIMTPKK